MPNHLPYEKGSLGRLRVFVMCSAPSEPKIQKKCVGYQSHDPKYKSVCIYQWGTDKPRCDSPRIKQGLLDNLIN